jgi:hypothetical protein
VAWHDDQGVSFSFSSLSGLLEISRYIPKGIEDRGIQQQHWPFCLLNKHA